MKNLKTVILSLVVVLSILFINYKSYSHCEIPCGIYGDSVRIALIKEHIVTIEKSIHIITKLSGEAKTDYNQLVRWVANKEEHAKKIQDIISQYFLHQRVKVTDSTDKLKYNNYVKQLTLLHKMQVYAMKTKQSTDLENIKILCKTLGEFENLYFHKHDH